MSHSIRNKRIAVLMGGLSSEREISLRTGSGVLASLQRRGREAVGLDWRVEPEIDRILTSSGAEVVWNALHGTWGEDGWIQRRLEQLRIPYTGSGPEASELAMDKVRAKKIFEAASIPTPEWKVIPPGSNGADHGLGETVVVKPSREGSTVGVTVVHRSTEMAAAVEEAARHPGEVIVERFIAGTELSVAILGERALGIVEIRPRSGFYDYRAKYLSGDTEYLVPAPLAPELDARVRDLAERSHSSLGCSCYSRVDMRLDEQGRPWVLEVNTLPGMTETSLLPKISRQAGIDYDMLVERILEAASLKG